MHEPKHFTNEQLIELIKCAGAVPSISADHIIVNLASEVISLRGQLDMVRNEADYQATNCQLGTYYR